MFMCVYSVTRSCPTVWNPRHCSPPGSSVHGIFQVRILEWVTIPFSRECSQPWGWTHIFCNGRQIPYHWATREAQLQKRASHTLWVSCLTDPVIYLLPKSPKPHIIFNSQKDLWSSFFCCCLVANLFLTLLPKTTMCIGRHCVFGD